MLCMSVIVDPVGFPISAGCSLSIACHCGSYPVGPCWSVPEAKLLSYLATIFLSPERYARHGSNRKVFGWPQPIFCLNFYLFPFCATFVNLCKNFCFANKTFPFLSITF